MYFLWYMLIGLVAGYVASLIVKGNGSGFWLNLIVGIIGGVLGGWLFSLFGLIAVGTLGSLITSVAGAIVLLLIALRESFVPNLGRCRKACRHRC